MAEVLRSKLDDTEIQLLDQIWSDPGYKRASSEINEDDLALIASAQSQYLGNEPVSGQINQDDLALIAAVQSQYREKEVESSGNQNGDVKEKRRPPVYANYSQFLKGMIQENTSSPGVWGGGKKPLPEPRYRDSFKDNEDSYHGATSKSSGKRTEVSECAVRIVYGENENLVWI